MKKPLLIGISIIIFVLSGILIYQKWGVLSGATASVELDWRLLGELDYITGKAPQELHDIDGKKVKIPGFMVPLEDNQKKVVEFLLVPTPQACIHVPPPPPNQMVYVKMKNGVEAAFGPIWVYGDLKLTTKNSIYGDSSFEVSGDKIEVYSTN